MSEPKQSNRRGRQLNVAVDPRLKAWLRAYAKANGQVMRFVVGEALAAYRASKEATK